MDVLLNIEKLVSMGQWIYQDEQDAYNIEISSLIHFVPTNFYIMPARMRNLEVLYKLIISGWKYDFWDFVDFR